MLKRVMLFAVIFASLLTLKDMSSAQSNEIILTISLNHGSVLNERILQGFYETHPNVKIVPLINQGGEMSYGGDAQSVSEIETVLDKAEDYYSRSDIVTVSMANLHPFATRAGYVLDMMPYIRADSQTYDDFYPVALKMYQWDGGLWGLPMGLNPWFMTYDPTAFEAADFPDPDESWTLDDYLEAGRALTKRDADDAVTQPGFFTQDYYFVASPLFGLRFYNGSTQPETPWLAYPEYEDVVSRMDAYTRELSSNSAGGWLSSDIPLQMGGLYRLSDDGGQTPYKPASMSGEQALVIGDGLAISAGTQHPDLAYEFIAYLTSDAEAVVHFWSEVPARRSLEGQHVEGYDLPLTSDVIDVLLPRILEKGVPTSELRYGEYLYAAQMKMYGDNPLSIHEALQEVQQEATDNLNVADARRDKNLIVATPVPTPGLASNEVALTFLVQTRFSPVPNQESWEQLAETFAENDAEVGHVTLRTDLADMTETFQTIHCAYTTYNAIPLIDLLLLQPLDPFLATDNQFDRSDIPEVLWPSVTRDEKIYGLPMTLLPLMMWYNPNLFEAEGSVPQNGWTMSDFIDTLAVLQDTQPDQTPYQSQTAGNVPYLMMAAGLGGVAVDYTTDTPTYHLTEPAVVEALRQTLDLAKRGLIHYVELDPASPLISLGQSALYDAVGPVDSWENIGTALNPVLPVTFPRGAETIPLSYTVGAGYITAQTPYPEACYRWLSTVAQHPELFYEMPARRSYANSDSLIAAHGQKASDVYVSLFEMIDNPQAVLIPMGSTITPSTAIPNIWLNQAMDAYVLEDKDLRLALEQAQAFIDEYHTCTAGIELIDLTRASAREKRAYNQQFTDCAIGIDPSLQERFE